MPETVHSFYQLDSCNSSLVIDCRSNAPAILYWGVKLDDRTTPEMLALLTTRQEAQAGPQEGARISLSPEFGTGFPGSSGIHVHRDGRNWAIHTQLDRVVEGSDNSLIFESSCVATALQVQHFLALDQDSGVLVANTELKNLGSTKLQVERCNAPCIPLPLHYDKILGFEGRWSHEFQMRHVDRFLGTYLRENRAGRTSHDSFPGVVIHTAQTNESIGGAFGLHLGWSGNHRISVEELSEGVAFAQLGELFFPGELQLQSGESYRSPTLYGARTHDGFSGLSACFHRFARGRLVKQRKTGKFRPVHFNTWEAMYFDLTTEKLQELATEAADIGIERFVVDDGWFRNRNNDGSGLGDWYVDEAKFPDGLGPIVDFVLAKDMEFGLWVEPEMVNPDSDLYRAHPDWVLSANPAPLAMARNQLVLDLTREEVTDYLFERLSSLLSEYTISYLKWDMNRNLSQPGDAEGRAATHRQTHALYKLLERLKTAYPDVEIESCSSGGARADYGILTHTDRIWTSDTNDALDRLRIQKGFSFFFPPELMGAHVGPFECHTTGRRISMSMRAGVAMFGHMGVEANLLDMSNDDKQELKEALALHKKHRNLILGSELIRLDLPTYESGFGIIAPDKKEAMFSYALLAGHPNSLPGRFRFRGLDAANQYEMKLIWPKQPYKYSHSILDIIDGAVLSGDALMRMGMQLPYMMPESLLIFHLKAVQR